MKHFILEKARSHKYIRRTGASRAYKYIYDEPEGKTFKMEPGVTEENRGTLWTVTYRRGSVKRPMTVRALSEDHAKQLVLDHVGSGYEAVKVEERAEGAGWKPKTFKMEGFKAGVRAMAIKQAERKAPINLTNIVAADLDVDPQRDHIVKLLENKTFKMEGKGEIQEDRIKVAERLGVKPENLRYVGIQHILDNQYLHMWNVEQEGHPKHMSTVTGEKRGGSSKPKTFKMEGRPSGDYIKVHTQDEYKKYLEGLKNESALEEWKGKIASPLVKPNEEKSFEQWKHALTLSPQFEGKITQAKTFKMAGGDPQIARTIGQQMGGLGRIKAMTGAKNFLDLGNGLSFDFPNRKGPNHVRVTLAPDDTYTVEFYKKPGMRAMMSGKLDSKKMGKHKGIYFDQLKDLFEHETGLYLSL